MAYVGIGILGIVLTPQTIRFVSEPYATSPTVVWSNLILSESGIIFGNRTAGFTFWKFCFNLSTDSTEVLLTRFWWSWIEQLGKGTLLRWMSEEWRGLKCFSVMIGLCFPVLFPAIPNCLGLEIQLRLSVRWKFFFHMAATTTFSGWAYFVTLSS